MIRSHSGRDALVQRLSGAVRGTGDVDIRQIRQALRSMPQRIAPPELDLKLRVLASQQASYRRQTRGSRAVAVWQRVRSWANELMRPVALPTAGGFASAVVLFGLLAPSLALRSAPVEPFDIPTALYTEASVKSSLPLAYDGDEMLVELTVDEAGRMVDYSLPAHVQAQFPMPARRNIENHLLTMVFNPATTFGQPIAGRVRIWLRNSKITIRG